MSAGGGLHKVWGPYDDGSGTPHLTIWVLAYEAGAYTVAKNFWTAEAKTGAVTERQGPSPTGGSNAAYGTVDGYFDGDYNIRIYESDKVTLIAEYANVHLTADIQDWEGTWGTAQPAAAAATKGKVFSTISAGHVVREVAVNANAAWTSIATYNASGNQEYVSVITATMPTYNVKHSTNGGALGDGTTGDGPKVKQGADLLVAAGGGVLYFPTGIYNLDDYKWTIGAAPIRIVGDGPGQTIIKRTAAPGVAGAMITYTPTDITYPFEMENLSLETTVAGASGDHALVLTWPTDSAITYRSNFYMNNVHIGPTNADKATARWDYDIQLTDCKKGIVDKCVIRGNVGNTSNGQGIRLLGNTDKVSFVNSYMNYKDVGIMIAGSTSEVYIQNSNISDCDIDVNAQVTANIKVHDSRLASMTECIHQGASALPVLDVSNSSLTKHSASTEDWRGINGDFANYSITGNKIQDAGSSSGTDYGIVIGASSTDGAIENNRILEIRTDGIRMAAGVSDFNINSNRINNAVNGINVLAGASDNYAISNNNLEGCTATITDGGTGLNKAIEANVPKPLVGSTLASAASLTIPAHGKYFVVSGTTNVTSIPTGSHNWVGRQVTLRFQDILTFTDGSTLFLEGNFVTTANDVITLVCDGTVWYEISRSVNR